MHVLQIPSLPQRFRPGPQDERLTDRRGRPYWLRTRITDEQIAFVHLFHQWGRAGEALVALETSGIYLIGDLEIRDRFRNRGLGSALLGKVISMAREQGASIVYGNISAKDLAVTPRLLGFYERHGFTVQQAQDPKWVASVSLVL
jgi:GNAT superfamily N-acetyltransferase